MPSLFMVWNIYDKDKKCEVLMNLFSNGSVIFESFKTGFHSGKSISRSHIPGHRRGNFPKKKDC